jgi:hypothetical protein
MDGDVVCHRGGRDYDDRSCGLQPMLVNFDVDSIVVGALISLPDIGLLETHTIQRLFW